MIKGTRAICATAVVSVLMFMPSLGWSASVFVTNAKIVNILQDGVNYGGCMARLNKSLVAEGLNCPADPMVTFDCFGTFASKSAGTTVFAGAQLAFVADKAVDLVVDDSKKHNGFCYARRIDVR